MSVRINSSGLTSSAADSIYARLDGANQPFQASNLSLLGQGGIALFTFDDQLGDTLVIGVTSNVPVINFNNFNGYGASIYQDLGTSDDFIINGFGGTAFTLQKDGAAKIKINKDVTFTPTTSVHVENASLLIHDFSLGNHLDLINSAGNAKLEFSSCGSVEFNNATVMSIGTNASGTDLLFNTTGVLRWYMATSTGHFVPYADATNDIGVSSQRVRDAYLSGTIKKINNVTTQGFGVATIDKVGRATAQTAANTSVVTFTPAADGTFIVSANVLVTTSTLHNFTVTCAYTDEGNTARTITMPFSVLAGTFVTAITNASGTVPYEGIPIHIRVKASTAITVATAGTFTTVTYNVEGVIQQLA